ncbi:MAG: MFS transporter [Sphingobium sp.]
MNHAATVNPPKAISRNIVLFFAAAVYLVAYMDRQIFALLLPAINEDFAMTDTQIGQLTGIAFPVVYGLGTLVMAIAADRWNRVKLIGWSTALFSAMTMACGAATSFGTMFIARLGVGLGEAGPTPPSLSLVADHFHGPARQVANSIFSAAAAFGMLAAYVFIGNLSVAYGWRTGFHVAGAMGIVIGISVLFFLRDTKRAASHQPISLGDFRQFPAFFRIRAFRWAAAAAFLNTVLTEASVQWLPLFLTRSLHMTQTQISWFLGLNYCFLGLLGIMVGGSIATRLRRKSVGTPQLLGCAVAFLITVCYVTVCLSTHILVSQIALGIIIFLTISAYGSLLAFVQDVTPSSGHAKVIALLFFIMQVGQGAGALLIGVLSDALAPHFGIESLRYALLPVVGISGLLASFCYFRASRHGDADAARAMEESRGLTA